MISTFLKSISSSQKKLLISFSALYILCLILIQIHSANLALPTFSSSMLQHVKSSTEDLTLKYDGADIRPGKYLSVEALKIVKVSGSLIQFRTADGGLNIYCTRDSGRYLIYKVTCTSSQYTAQPTGIHVGQSKTAVESESSVVFRKDTLTAISQSGLIQETIKAQNGFVKSIDFSLR